MMFLLDPVGMYLAKFIRVLIYFEIFYYKGGLCKKIHNVVHIHSLGNKGIKIILWINRRIPYFLKNNRILQNK